MPRRTRHESEGEVSISVPTSGRILEEPLYGLLAPVILHFLAKSAEAGTPRVRRIAAAGFHI
jgi:hypothetical protein